MFSILRMTTIRNGYLNSNGFGRRYTSIRNMYRYQNEHERHICEQVWELATRSAYRYVRRGELCNDPMAMANHYSKEATEE